VQNFDGVDITYEYGTPADTGYGLNVDQMEVRSMQGQLFVPTARSTTSPRSRGASRIDFFGNTCGTRGTSSS
jgi:hypothetical protein